MLSGYIFKMIEEIFKGRLLCIILILTAVINLQAQENYKEISREDSLKVYSGGQSYPVKTYTQEFKTSRPKNIILMIGDGMGIAHVFAGETANHGHLFLDNFKNIGFSRTQSANNYITDSGAGGTALSTGEKTYNGGIGVDRDTIPVKTVLEYAEDKGKSTGLIATAAITHATPAAFIAHQPKRTMYEDIAADFLKTDIDVFIGGGYKHFYQRSDGRDLILELEKKGYKVLKSMNQIAKVRSGKLAGLTALEHNPDALHRDMNLPLSTYTALNILDNNENGFFLMVEGSQIDWGGHQNNTNFLVNEMLDFDQAIGQVLDFAAKDGETLVVVTSDHETGGFSIIGGDMGEGMVNGAFSTGHHTGVVVPVFAYGPGGAEFTGIMENTEIGKKLIEFINNDD